MEKREKMKLPVKNVPQGLFLFTHFGRAAATVLKKREKIWISIKNGPQGLFF